MDPIDYRSCWSIRPDTLYLNHGSFGPPPDCVRAAQQQWKCRLDEQPMDFFLRIMEPAWRAARDKLAEFVATSPENLAFVENATYGMNVVARSFRLDKDEEVLLTDHEYGAVKRIWERSCAEQGAQVRVARLPWPMDSADEIVDSILQAITPRTRLLIVSHVTSPTAVTLPVARLIPLVRARGIAVCVDGPHAPAYTDLNLDNLQCDYYVASCHKWLSAPLGSGFLFVAPQRQSSIRSPLLSWGRLLPDVPVKWYEEFIWTGTRDPSPYLSLPAALDFLQNRVGLRNFRERTHSLARSARQQIGERFGTTPMIPDGPEWYGSMAHVPLPPGDHSLLQRTLWERYKIEVPIISWAERRFVRVSCHLYNDQNDLDRLLEALSQLIHGQQL